LKGGGGSGSSTMSIDVCRRCFELSFPHLFLVFNGLNDTGIVGASLVTSLKGLKLGCGTVLLPQGDLVFRLLLLVPRFALLGVEGMKVLVQGHDFLIFEHSFFLLFFQQPFFSGCFVLPRSCRRIHAGVPVVLCEATGNHFRKTRW
jgi:hypothetical protein